MSRATRFYRVVSSVDTGLVLLFLIGLHTAVGSVAFPSGFFHAVVFRLLILLLLANLVLCTFAKLNRFVSRLLRGAAAANANYIMRHTGVIMLHLGIVLVLIGAAINNFFGYSREITVLEGQTVNLSPHIEAEASVYMTLDAFDIAVYEDGSPSQFYSHVTLHSSKGQKVKRVISVNHPLVIGGMKVYQTGFAYLVKVEAVADSVSQPERLVRQREHVRIPRTGRVVKVVRYFTDFDPQRGMLQTSTRTGDARVLYSVYENDRLIGVGAAEPGRKVMVDDGVFVVFHGVEPMTILRVKSDPGLGLAAAGGVLLVSGVIAAMSAGSVDKRSIFDRHGMPEEGI